MRSTASSPTPRRTGGSGSGVCRSAFRPASLYEPPTQGGAAGPLVSLLLPAAEAGNGLEFGDCAEGENPARRQGGKRDDGAQGRNARGVACRSRGVASAREGADPSQR